MKNYFILIFILIPVFSFSQEDTIPPPPPPPPAEVMAKAMRAWQNDSFKIKLFLPPHWADMPLNGSEILLIASPSYQIFSLRAYHLVFPGTIDEIRLRADSTLKKEYPKCEIISSKLIKIGYIDATDVTMQGDIGKRTGIMRNINFHNSVHSFMVNCFYLLDDKEKSEKVIDIILQSLKFY